MRPLRPVCNGAHLSAATIARHRIASYPDEAGGRRSHRKSCRPSTDRKGPDMDTLKDETEVRKAPSSLAKLRNVGRATLADFRVLGIATVDELAAQDPDPCICNCARSLASGTIRARTMFLRPRYTKPRPASRWTGGLSRRLEKPGSMTAPSRRQPCRLLSRISSDRVRTFRGPTSGGIHGAAVPHVQPTAQRRVQGWRHAGEPAPRLIWGRRVGRGRWCDGAWRDSGAFRFKESDLTKQPCELSAKLGRPAWPSMRSRVSRGSAAAWKFRSILFWHLQPPRSGCRPIPRLAL